MGSDLHLDLRRESEGRLYAHVTGMATLDNTLHYWRRIAEAIEQQPASQLLLVDELVGGPLTAEDWTTLVADVGSRLGNLRIAHVKPRGLETVEYCVLSAMERGLSARVFEDEHRASVWLRYSPDER